MPMNRGLFRQGGPYQPGMFPWDKINGAGTLALRPTACPANRGFRYLATDASGGTVYRSTGSAWQQEAGPVNPSFASLPVDAHSPISLGDTVAGVFGGASERQSVRCIGGAIHPGVCGGRLTTSSSSPNANAPGASTTLYWQPWFGDHIGLFDGFEWKVYAGGGSVSVALGTLTSGALYDVFASGGNPVILELLAWTSGGAGTSARATALTTQDGILVKTGDLTKRYLGTIRTSSTTQTTDSATQRFVWNLYNPILRSGFVSVGGSSTYASTTVRAWNASGSAIAEFVIGLVGYVRAVAQGFCQGVDHGTGAHVCCAFNGTSDFTDSANYNTGYVWMFSEYTNGLNAGYNYAQICQYADGGTGSFTSGNIQFSLMG